MSYWEKKFPSNLYENSKEIVITKSGNTELDNSIYDVTTLYNFWQVKMCLAHQHVDQPVQSEDLISPCVDKSIELWLQSGHFLTLSTLQSFLFDMGKLVQFQHTHNLRKKVDHKLSVSQIITEPNIELDQHSVHSTHIEISARFLIWQPWRVGLWFQNTLFTKGRNQSKHTNTTQSIKDAVTHSMLFLHMPHKTLP